MKVLVADLSLGKTGGGSAIYESLISLNPQIEFYYFANEFNHGKIPKPNAHPIPLKRVFMPSKAKGFLAEAYKQAISIAKSAEGMSFDAIDIPDYYLFGLFLRQTFKEFNVSYKRLVLALHGSVSTSTKLNWFEYDSEAISHRIKYEIDQYKICDVRYGISKRYLFEWQKKGTFEGAFVNPLSFLKIPCSSPYDSSSSEKPSLTFMGRLEKWKGPDVFLEVAHWLPKSTYSHIQVIGQNVYHKKENARCYLKNYAFERGLKVDFFDSFSASKKRALFSSKTSLILPSRYDTLNLVGLEALLNGCPLAVGNGAGICDFLDEFLPKLPYINIEMESFFSSLPQLIELLENYDEHRHFLNRRLLDSTLLYPPIDFRAIYEGRSQKEELVIDEMEVLYEEINRSAFSLSFSIASLLKRGVKKVVPIDALSKFKNFPIKTKFRNWAKKSTFLKLLWMSTKISRLRFACVKGRTLEQLNHDLKGLKIKRVKVWNEIASLQRRVGNSLISATYDLRILRALGFDKFNRLNLVISELESNGFYKEAHVARLMYGTKQSEEQCFQYLTQNFHAHKRIEVEQNYEIFEDLRAKKSYRVTIVASLYKAASKLEFFLKAIQQQTLCQKGEAEVILLETGSPTSDYEVFKRLRETLKIPILYARTAQRETIQSAWNRAITLSRGSYLCFLGVDETNVPSGLETLAEVLDQHPYVDWVQANSLVTDVDEKGLWVRDVMKYDREGFCKEKAYLETCYVSWVGALYRKSIHDRFGYYDPTFRAAGDTEFKNRILPHIEVKYLPLNLGIFWNYPDERATSSPLAEIEDLRAWYLYRTTAGIRYAFSSYSLQELEKMFFSCLSYRKSFCRHQSFDLIYADLLLGYVKDKFPQSSILQYEGTIKKSLKYLSLLEENGEGYYKYIGLQILEKMKKTARFSRNSLPIYPFHDNRFEQHSMVWK